MVNDFRNIPGRLDSSSQFDSQRRNLDYANPAFDMKC